MEILMFFIAIPVCLLIGFLIGSVIPSPYKSDNDFAFERRALRMEGEAANWKAMALVYMKECDNARRGIARLHRRLKRTRAQVPGTEEFKRAQTKKEFYTTAQPFRTVTEAGDSGRVVDG